jgi:hypothetical protein
MQGTLSLVLKLDHLSTQDSDICHLSRFPGAPAYKLYVLMQMREETYKKKSRIN